MKMILQKTIYLLFIAIILTSCSKEKDNCAPHDEASPCYAGPSGFSDGDKLLLIEQKINGKTIGRFEYDEQNRMIHNYPYSEDGINKTTIRYTYDSSGRLLLTTYTNEDGNVNLKEEYTYGSGRSPVSMVQSDLSGPDELIIDWQYIYNNNLLMNETATPREGDPLITTTSYTYDNKGNQTSIEQRTDGLWLVTLEYGDFDDKTAIFGQAHPYWWKGTHLSNPRAEKISSLNTNANRDLVIKYTYNGAGYPTKAEAYSRGTDILIETREYVYQKAN